MAMTMHTRIWDTSTNSMSSMHTCNLHTREKSFSFKKKAKRREKAWEKALHKTAWALHTIHTEEAKEEDAICYHDGYRRMSSYVIWTLFSSLRLRLLSAHPIFFTLHTAVHTWNIMHSSFFIFNVTRYV